MTSSNILLVAGGLGKYIQVLALFVKRVKFQRVMSAESFMCESMDDLKQRIN